MHPCGVHICCPKKMGEFGVVQTVENNMKLFSKQKIAGAVRARNLYKRSAVRARDLYEKSAVQARDLYEKMIFYSTLEFRAV